MYDKDKEKDEKPPSKDEEQVVKDKLVEQFSTVTNHLKSTI